MHIALGMNTGATQNVTVSDGKEGRARFALVKDSSRQMDRRLTCCKAALWYEVLNHHDMKFKDLDEDVVVCQAFVTYLHHLHKSENTTQVCSGAHITLNS